MNDFDITKEEAEHIFREMIVPQTIGSISPQPTKKAFLLGGQPGSGKSAFAREILKNNKNIVFVNGDDLRAYHPKYYFYLKENDVEAADMTQAVCNFWIESLISKCAEIGVDCIIEGTMRKKEVPIKTASLLREADYEVDIAVIATPYEVSLFSVGERYKELKRLGQPARFTKKESHDEAYNNIENTFKELITWHTFDNIFVYKRKFGEFEKGVFTMNEKEKALAFFKDGRIRLVEPREIEKPFFGENIVMK